MRDTLAGWRRRTVDGGFLLVAPDPMSAAVRIRTQIAIQPVGSLVASMVKPGFGGAPFVARGAPRRFVTDEGEHVALVELVARPGDLTVRRTIAVVVGDHAMLAIDGRATHPADFDLTSAVRAVARATSLGLGTDRWRPYFYAAPPGWHRLARHAADTWFAPDYPRNPGTITVFHARLAGPRASAAQHANLFEMLPAEYKDAEVLDRRPTATTAGLTGERITLRAQIDGEPRRATNALVGDHYLHLLRLETDDRHAAANGAIFDAVLGSVEAVPPVRTPDAGAFSHYTE